MVPGGGGSYGRSFPLREEGVETALRLAKEVNDTEFISLVQQYANNATEKMEVYLSRQLLSPKREALYQHIYELVQKASSPYPPRDYGETKNLEIRHKRRQVEKELHSCGYVGHYPEYHKKNTHVLVTEEQPFTMLEWDDFHFRQQLMVSKSRGKRQGRNAGFFRGFGRSGKIVNWEQWR